MYCVPPEILCTVYPLQKCCMTPEPTDADVFVGCQYLMDLKQVVEEKLLMFLLDKMKKYSEAEMFEYSYFY